MRETEATPPYSYAAEGIPVRAAKRHAGWVLFDANGFVVSDEFGEAYAYTSKEEAVLAITTFRVGQD